VCGSVPREEKGGSCVCGCKCRQWRKRAVDTDGTSARRMYSPQDPGTDPLKHKEEKRRRRRRLQMCRMWLLRQLATRRRCRTKDVPCKKSGLAGVVRVCVCGHHAVVCVEPRRGLDVRRACRTSRALWPSYAVRREAAAAVVVVAVVVVVVVVVVASCHCVYHDVCVC